MMMLMIVDDNSDIRGLIRSFTEDLATGVVECADGSQALRIYAEHKPDWVLMDIEMPGLDGITATRQIRTAFPDARVLIVTQYDDRESREEASRAGACGYVLKENLFELRRILRG